MSATARPATHYPAAASGAAAAPVAWSGLRSPPRHGAGRCPHAPPAPGAPAKVPGDRAYTLQNALPPRPCELRLAPPGRCADGAGRPVDVVPGVRSTRSGHAAAGHGPPPAAPVLPDTERSF